MNNDRQVSESFATLGDRFYRLSALLRLTTDLPESVRGELVALIRRRFNEAAGGLADVRSMLDGLDP